MLGGPIAPPPPPPAAAPAPLVTTTPAATGARIGTGAGTATWSATGSFGSPAQPLPPGAGGATTAARGQQPSQPYPQCQQPPAAAATDRSGWSTSPGAREIAAWLEGQDQTRSGRYLTYAAAFQREYCALDDVAAEDDVAAALAAVGVRARGDMRKLSAAMLELHNQKARRNEI
jgi:hypothetical protein